MKKFDSRVPAMASSRLRSVGHQQAFFDGSPLPDGEAGEVGGLEQGQPEFLAAVLDGVSKEIGVRVEIDAADGNDGQLGSGRNHTHMPITPDRLR
jgi:hypothetical protein